MVGAQDSAYGHFVDVMTQIRQRALDAPIPPGGVVLCHANDQLLDLLCHR